MRHLEGLNDDYVEWESSTETPTCYFGEDMVGTPWVMTQAIWCKVRWT
jgi:hypothetical protein